MPTAGTAVRQRPWESHSVIVALVLAVLVPGLGHLFQGRTLKGLIYLFGILGLFIWGVKLGEGVVVYNMPDQGSRRITLHYAAQLCAGAIAYPGLWQPKRLRQENNHTSAQLDKPLNAPFTGRLVAIDDGSNSGQLQGTVSFQGEYGSETVGTFTGTLDGKPIKLRLGGRFFLDKPIAAGFRRELKCGVVDDANEANAANQMIIGAIPRPIMDGYGIPPDLPQLQEITGRLGKVHELALVFTWIAGLLNILAIWDCVQGPAYGFGDEYLPEPQKAKEPAESPAQVAQPVTPTATEA